MINPEELAICRKRGHVAPVTTRGWTPCSACGMWLVEKRTIEEREDEPPEHEIDPALQSERHIAAMKRKLEQR